MRPKELYNLRRGQAAMRDRQLVELLAERGLVTPDEGEHLLAEETETSLADRLAAEGRFGPAELAELEREVDLRVLAGAAEDSALPDVVDRAASDPARHIDRYVIVERLGAGGMGEVHRAWDTRLGRWVALKLLHSAEPGAVERFLREAHLLARLSHPNVTQVYDAGVHEGRPWLAMELVERARAPDGEVARRRAAELVRDAARGVQHAHESGIVHRDLKPSNLLESSSGRVYVSDFGLARALAEEGTTVTGELLGTPAFMAPEQALGRTADRRTDVWGLGATLYGLVEGKPPFSGESFAEVVHRVVMAPPPRLSGDDDLVVVVAKAMEREREDRYQSAAELADDLERYLLDEPVRARRIGTLGRMLRRARRRPLVAAAAGLVLVLVVAAGWWGAQRLIDARRREAEVRAAAPFVAEARTILEQVRRLERSDAGGRELFDRAVADLIARTSRAVEVAPRDVEALKLNADALIAAERFADAEGVLDRVLALDPGDADARGRRAYARLMQVELDAPDAVATATGMTFTPAPLSRSAEERVRAAADDWRQVPSDHPDRPFGEAVLAFVRGDPARCRDILKQRLAERPYLMVERRILASADLLTGDYGDAEARATELIERGFEVGMARSLRAYARAAQGHFEEAAEDMEAALELHPDWTPQRGFLAFWLLHLGRFDEALAEIDRALQDDPSSIAHLKTRCIVLSSLGRREEAVATARRLTGLAPEDAEAWYHMGVALAGQDGAIAAFDRSLALDPSSVTTLGQRGLAKLQTGDLAGAEADARAAADADPRFAAWWWTLSLALAEQGRYDEAEQAVSAGIDATGGTLSLFEERAEVRLALGDCAGARADLAEMERRGAAVDPDLVEQTRSLCSSGAGGSD